MIAEAIEHRQAAIDQTAPEISRLVLSAMPELVAHPGPPLAPGPYYTDADLNVAICATADEAMILHDVCLYAQPMLVIEIGSYIGWTAAHMALAMRRGKLLCFDALTESASPTAQAERWHDNIKRANVSSKTELLVGTSPECLASITNPVDIAFIDGNHLQGQPLRDVQGLVPHMTPDGVIAMHDTWMFDVQVACNWLIGEGWYGIWFDTPAKLALFCKHTPDWLAVFKKGL